MRLNEAIDKSRIQAARGYDKAGKCVVSIAYYGGQLTWLTGWGGNWAPEWKAIPQGEKSKLDELDFKPSGPPPPIEDFELARELFEEEETPEGPISADDGLPGDQDEQD